MTRIREIDGNLTIRGTITSFPNFRVLEVVEGNITISGLSEASFTALTDIFPALDSIRGNLTIENNNNVQTISGFVELDSVGGNLSINGNTSLTTLPDFDALTRIEGNFIIDNNDALTTLSGFGSLTNITGNLTITGNTSLSSCYGLLSIAENDVTPVGGTTLSGNATGCNDAPEIIAACVRTTDLTINADADFPSNGTTFVRLEANLTIGGTITSFPDFAGLKTVERKLTINNITTGTLTDLTGIFPALEEVTGYLVITNNANVTTITGFGAIASITGKLTITGNTSLSS